MLIAGIDVSGKPGIGNHAYMAIVIGTVESIDQVFNDLGQKYIHMSRIKNTQEQNKIIGKVRFDQKQNLALCINMDMNVIVDELFNSKKNKKRRIPRVKFIRIFHQRLLKLVRYSVEEFLVQHKYSLSDIKFECDSDCRNFIKQNGLHHTDVGRAHMIADIVAWANHRNKEPKGAIPLNMTNHIRSSVTKYLKL